MIEEDAVAELHLIAEQIASLIVPHTIPARRLIGLRRQIFDRVAGRLGFDQPILFAL
jgi:hypothetical protein